MSNEISPRLGPIERAIQARNKEKLFEALHKRAVPEPGTGCLRWVGNKRPQGYAMVGHGRTNRLVHRLVAWAEAGFPGELKDFPNVHHSCSTRDCIRADHVLPATAYVNILERSVRNSFTARLRALEAVVRELAPTHAVLAYPEFRETPLPGARAGKTYESTTERLKRLRSRAEAEEKKRERQQYRFEQIARVERLVKEGLTRKEALMTVGMNRRVYQYWTNELRILLEEDAA